MFIIFNISGLLVGVAGVFVGLVVFLLSGWLSLGVLALGIVWFGLGVYWRKTGVAPGAKRPYPALFFIPLPFVAVPIALLAFPLLLVEWGARSQPADPRAPLLKADERTLDSALVGGDQRLSRAVLDGLQVMTVEEAGADAYHVFSRRRGDAVLVLVKVPNLKDYEDSARRQLLNLISKIAEADPSSSGERIYVGVKGRLVYGAMKLPSGKTIIKGVIGEDDLYAFYDTPLNTSGQTEVKAAEVEPRPLEEGYPSDQEMEQAAATPDNEIAMSSSIAHGRSRPLGRGRASDSDSQKTSDKKAEIGDYAGPRSLNEAHPRDREPEQRAAMPADRFTARSSIMRGRPGPRDRVRAGGSRDGFGFDIRDGRLGRPGRGSGRNPQTMPGRRAGVGDNAGRRPVGPTGPTITSDRPPRRRRALSPPVSRRPDQAKSSAHAGNAANDLRARKAVEASRPDAQATARSETGLGAYAGPGSVPPTGRKITADTRLVEGMVVQAHWGSSWFPATIREVDGDSILIEWNGWNQRETLPRSRLALAPPEIPQPKGAPSEP